MTGYRSREHQSFEAAAARQSHINLSEAESLARIDDSLVESQTLALVDGNGPGRLERNLSERANEDLLDLSGLVVGLIFHVEPFLFIHFNDLFLVVVALAFDDDLAVGNLHHTANLSIVVSFFGRRVVLAEHHLCAYLQCQLCIGRIGALGKFALHRCRERLGVGFQLIHVHLVDLLCLVVVGCQCYVTLAVLRPEVGDVAAVQDVECLLVDGVVAHLVEHRDESLVLLAEHLGELDGGERSLSPSPAAEEIWCLISCFQYVPFFF